MSDPNWDDFDIDDEVITEQEAEEIESGSSFPVGLWLCRVVETKPKEINFKNYATFGVNIKFEIEKVLEVQKRPPTDQEIKQFTGKHMFDDVAFAHELEKEGMAKRRKLVALKIGLIKHGEILRKNAWRDHVIDKRVIVRTELNTYKDKKTGKDKTNTRIGFFDGYESVGQVEKVVEKAEGWDDI